MATRPGRKRSYAYYKAAKAYRAKLIAQGPQSCYFCGGPIDMDLHHYDKWAFTIQHITPISRGGAEADEENFAPAHRSCNAREGNRLAGTTKEDGDLILGPSLKQSRVW